MIAGSMMWRKSSWERRFRVILAALVVAPLIAGGASFIADPATGGKDPQATLNFLAQMIAGMVVPLMTLLMAGSGVNSQTSWGMLHGFHASMYFLLSMPVSRRRALLIRAAVGAAFTFLFIVIMMAAVAQLSAWQGVAMSGGRVIGGIVFLSLGAFTWFGLSTLLSTLFDEFWGGIIGLTFMGFMFGLGLSQDSKKFSLLSYLGGLHFNRTGDIVWPALLTVLALGAAFMAASVYVVERKEYGQ